MMESSWNRCYGAQEVGEEVHRRGLAKYYTCWDLEGSRVGSQNVAKDYHGKLQSW